MAENISLREVTEIFKIKSLSSQQKQVFDIILNKKKDVFVNLPTGSGKSLIYQALPKIFDSMFGGKHLVVVVSPLINLMKDQVYNLRKIGINAVSLSAIESEDEANAVEKGEYSIVYGTPETWLKNQRWRRVLSSELFKKMLCAVAIDEAHVIKQWGISSSSKYVAFREAYGCLSELRSLVQQGVNFIALTATASPETKKCILNILHMEDFVEVYENPNKLNIMFSVSYIPQSTKIYDTFHWIIDKFVCTGSSMDRIIIYCQTIKQCTVVYSILRAALEKHSLFVQSTNHQQVPLEMLHSCTPNDNKDSIIKSFQNPQGAVRILVCTIAFGMGIDCKGVYTSIHFGPPKNVESYIQESGRIGRDGKPSRSFIIYQGILLGHVERDIKEYLKTTECRRNKLMNDFGVLPSNVQLPQPPHMCCDNCAVKCLCGMTTCKTYAIYPGQPNSESETNVPAPIASREVTTDHYSLLEKELLQYQKKLLMDVMAKTAKGQMYLHVSPQMLIGFGQVQISQVLDNCSFIFDIEDVYNYVEIWHYNHAYSIYCMVCNIFGDNNSKRQVIGVDDEDLDEENTDEWECFMEDDELLNMALENLSISQMDESQIMASDLSV